MSSADDLRAQLRDQSAAMARLAFERGLMLPSGVLALLPALEDELGGRTQSIAVLSDLHQRLAEAVAPARPAAVFLIMESCSSRSPLRFLGPLPAVRLLVMMILGFMVAFVTVSLSPVINHENVAKDIYDTSGLEMLILLAFVMSASGLGASFAFMVRVIQQVRDMSFEPRVDGMFWAELSLGMLAGLMLAELIPLGDGAAPGDEPIAILSKPLLALLGGFSSALVYRVLHNLVEAAESVFAGGRVGVEAARDRASKASESMAGERQRLLVANRLLALKGKIDPASGPAADELDTLIDEVLGVVAPAPPQLPAPSRPAAPQPVQIQPVAAPTLVGATDCEAATHR